MSTTQTPHSPPPDPFNAESLRLSQDFSQLFGVKQALMTVPVRKPDKAWFVRTHPEPEYRLETAVIELKEERETYLVNPKLWPELAAEATFSPRVFYTAVNRQGVVFLWPIRLPTSDGRHDGWSQSAMEGAEMGKGKWVRVQANMSLGAYEVWEATGELPDPKWPEQSLDELLRIAFKNTKIDTPDHTILRQLRGEA